MIDTGIEICALAARWVVENGLEYGPAKQRAAKQLGVTGRTPLPSNEALEDAVKDYIAVFCADTHPQELAELRQLRCNTKSLHSQTKSAVDPLS